MTTQIIDSNWHEVFNSCKTEATRKALIICPFIKLSVLKELLGEEPKEVKVITRFNLDDLFHGISDIEALEYLLNIGAQVKGIKNLHSKVYLFGSSTAIITSANLTHAALYRNMEYGLKADEISFAQEVARYFEQTWEKADKSLTKTMLIDWKERIKQAAKKYGNNTSIKLGDEGTDIGLLESTILDYPSDIQESLPQQCFIKFFGTSSNRQDTATPVIETIKDSGNHIVLTYPRNKRPRNVKDGDLMFYGWLVDKPNDIKIIGRATGTKHDELRDTATEVDIKKRPWRETWPHYIRVHDPVFINGTLADGISLNKLMADLGSEIFYTTSNNQLNGNGNTDPHKSITEQAAVHLAPSGAQIINSLLNDLLIRKGQITSADLSEID